VIEQTDQFQKLAKPWCENTALKKSDLNQKNDFNKKI